jgi:Swi5-dependent recombination DNA repair protein 1
MKNSASEDSISTASQSNVPLTPKSTNSLLSGVSRTLSLPAPSTTVATPNRSPNAKKTFSSPGQAAALNADPDIAPLLRAQRELEKQSREVKEELDTAEQARKIEADSAKKNPDAEIDGELLELIEKWRAASQQAAEELFGKVRDRVNKWVISSIWSEDTQLIR